MTAERFPARIVVGDLVIRPWIADDADDMAALIAENIGHLRPWMAWARNEPISTSRRLQLFARWDRYRAAGSGAVYAIEQAGRLVGGCALHRQSDVVEIGYWLGRSAGGRGIATRTVDGLTEAALDVSGVGVVQISHEAANRRSAGVAQRAGFVDVTPGAQHTVTKWRRRAAAGTA